jgi:hypothetical protein
MVVVINYRELRAPFFARLIIVERFMFFFNDVPLDEINALEIEDETKNIKSPLFYFLGWHNLGKT